jgi:hypothetical protein
MILRTLLTLIGLALVPFSAKADLDLKQLFWGSKASTNLTEIELLARFEDINSTSFLFKDSRTSNLFLVDKIQYFTINDKLMQLTEINENKLLFETDQKQKFHYDLSNFFMKDTLGSHKKPLETSDVDGESEKFKKLLAPNLNKAEEIFKHLGFPNFLLEDSSKYLISSNSRAGRVGWKITKELPKIVLKMTPFKINDLILSIDSIPAIDLDILLLHISGKVKNGVFDIEIQRDGRLRLLRVSI